uniref:Uncharacterized protein LOC104211301 isoform X4 n=1 Tax=Nicotiana sylvestris TaxID=4096 RepID=A0A1U7URC2_NICSY|nr:PREDICTED: uncharacterized protein LOC104211301 isoform X4 [Nicotiana sylvestris]
MFKSQHGCCWSPRCHGQWWGYCTYWNEHGGSSSSKACCSFCCSCRHSQGILASLRHWSEGSDQYLSDRPLQKHGGGLEHNETYYGSCYGAEGSDDEAYRKKGWALSNLDIFDQLILEVGVEIGSFKTSLETSLRSKASYVTNKEKIRKEEYMVLDLKKNTTMGRIFMTLLDLMQHPQQHL